MKKKKVPATAKRAVKKGLKVWHISRFRQRYELADNVRFDRKTPLLYTKDFVRPSDEESCAYHRSLMALRSKSNWLEIRGAFAELKNYAGNMGKSYRGYLLNNKFEPASIKEIGRWLGINEEKAKEIINDLEDVGLLELIDMPVFDTDDDRAAKGKDKKKKKKKKKKTAKKKTSAKQSKSSIDNSVRARENTVGARARTRKSCSSLKKKTKAKAKVKKKVKIKAKVNGNDNNKRAKKRLSKEPQKAPTPTTQPFQPQIPQKGGRVVQFTAPSELKNTDLLGDIAKGMLHKYNPDAKRFALEIYEALQLPWDPTSEMGKRELGCFASAWEKVDTSDELRERAITEAKGVAKRKQNRKKGAVWVGIFQDLAAAYSRRRKISGM